MTSGISDKNRKILDLINRTQKGPFTAKDVSKTLKLSLKKTGLLLTYFATKEWLSRIKRGVYITVPLGTLNPKEFKENPWIVANKIFAPCYIGGWSAAEHWGLTEQIFNTVVVFTTRRAQRKNMTIQGTNFIIKFINKNHFGDAKSIWIDNSRIQISDPSQTIIDILDDPVIGGGIRCVAEIIKEYFVSDFRNDELIIKYITKRDNKTIYKRLGYIIEINKIDAAFLQKKCEKNISSGYSLLDPSSKATGSFNSKWQLRINIRINK